MPVDKADYRADAFFLRVVKSLFIGIYFSVFFYFLQKSAESHIKAHLIVTRQVRVPVDAGGDVVFFLPGL